MNLVRLISPDFFLGKLLIAIRAVFDVTWMLITSPSRQSWRLAGLILRVKPRYTMVTNWNLVNLYRLAHQINVLGLPGVIVECGVWNGGSSALMGAACKGEKPPVRRDFWLFDSFQGLPEPGEKDGKAATQGYFQGFCKGEPQKVREAFRSLGIAENTCHIVPGWFNETLHTVPIETIALLHVDADWYDSVKTVLDVFYDKVVPGGMVVFDDYGYWEGCRQAVDEFLAARGVRATLHKVSKTGAYFVKPSQGVAQ